MNIQATPALLASTIQSVRRAIGGNTDRGRDLGYVEALANHVDELMKRVDEIADRLSPPTERNGRSVTIAAREHATADDLVKLMSGCGDEWCHELADLPAPGLAARLHYTLHGAWDDLRLARVARAEAERDAEEQAQWKPQLDEAKALVQSQLDSILQLRKAVGTLLGWDRARYERADLTELVTAAEQEAAKDPTPEAGTLLEIRGVFGNCARCHSLLGPEFTDVTAVAKVHESMHEGWKQYTGLAHRVRKALKRIQGAIDS